VVAVARGADRTLSLGGTGEPIEWLVEMNRFDEDDLFDRRAMRGTLDVGLMAPLGTAVARFHASAESTPDRGGYPGMSWVVEGNDLGFSEQGAGILEPSACRELTRQIRIELERRAGLLESRRLNGFVRRCHGDLHLRNLVLLGGRPTLFDAVEFNDAIACIDVQYDLAFLVMDLWRRRMRPHANAVWNAYLFETRDVGAVPLLPLFLACRAAVRAKTSATAARLQDDPARQADLSVLAREYLQMAATLIAPRAACLVAVGGFSGSGKSTLARALAPTLAGVPGAALLRSDEIRKQLAGVDTRRRLPAASYTSEMSARVYDTLASRAAAVLGGGHTAMVDAVYARQNDRIAIEEIAAAAQVPFVGLWLDAPEATLTKRAAARRADPSDADAAVIRRQLAEDPGVIGWQRLDATGTADDVCRAATDVLRDRLGADIVGAQ
jgi:aminoglycoside phosphotransferase family enzyme/predicted kinase